VYTNKRSRSELAPDSGEPAPTECPSRRRVSLPYKEQVPEEVAQKTDLPNPTTDSVSANSAAPGDLYQGGMHFSKTSSISLSSKDEHSPVTSKRKRESEHHPSLTLHKNISTHGSRPCKQRRSSATIDPDGPRQSKRRAQPPQAKAFKKSRQRYDEDQAQLDPIKSFERLHASRAAVEVTFLGPGGRIADAGVQALSDMCKRF